MVHSMLLALTLATQVLAGVAPVSQPHGSLPSSTQTFTLTIPTPPAVPPANKAFPAPPPPPPAPTPIPSAALLQQPKQTDDEAVLACLRLLCKAVFEEPKVGDLDWCQGLVDGVIGVEKWLEGLREQGIEIDIDVECGVDIGG